MKRKDMARVLSDLIGAAEGRAIWIDSAHEHLRVATQLRQSGNRAGAAAALNKARSARRNAYWCSRSIAICGAQVLEACHEA